MGSNNLLIFVFIINKGFLTVNNLNKKTAARNLKIQKIKKFVKNLK